MGFKIVKATVEDMDKILNLAVEYSKDNHQFKSLPFNKEHVRKCVEVCLALPNYVIYLAVNDDGDAVGGFWGYYAEQMFSPVRFARDAFVFVSKPYREKSLGSALLYNFESWAVQNKCVAVVGGANSGVDNNSGSNSMYLSNGYGLAGKEYLMMM